MLSFKRMSEVKDQLEWIATRNYDSYDKAVSYTHLTLPTILLV